MRIATTVGASCVAFLLIATGARADTYPLEGTLTYTLKDYHCTNGDNWAAPGDHNDIHCGAGGWGTSGYNGIDSWADVAGSIQFRVNFSGSYVPADTRLAPLGAYVTSYFAGVPGYCPYNGSCYESVECTYHDPPISIFGSHQGNFAGTFGENAFNGDDGAVGVYPSLSLPAPGDGIPFHVVSCNSSIGVGACPGGSLLHTPGPFAPTWMPPGYTIPFEYAGLGIGLAFSIDPGGMVTAMHATGAPPYPATSPSLLPGYWELHSDMDPGTFAVDLTLTYDPAGIPYWLSESGLVVSTYDTALAQWVPLPTTLDVVNHKATVTGLTHFSVFVLGATLPTGVPASVSPVFFLRHAFPNPTAGAVEVEFGLARESDVRLGVYDIRGALVRDLITGRLGAGIHHAHWDGRDRDGRPSAAGVYFVRLHGGEDAATESLIRVR